MHKNRVMRAMLAVLAFGLGTLQAAEPAPEFTLTDARGQQVRLSDFRGRYVVLEWTNHECPFVRKHYDSGNMQAQQRLAHGHGAVWLTIISSAPGKQGYVSGEQALAIAEDAGAEPDHILLDPDGTVGRAYGARTTPHMYLIDPQGRLLYRGGIDSIPSADKADLARAVQYLPRALGQALAGEPVDPASTRPYGCSIKYR